jgi:hypothetical protein
MPGSDTQTVCECSDIRIGARDPEWVKPIWIVEAMEAPMESSRRNGRNSALSLAAISLLLAAVTCANVTACLARWQGAAVAGS